MRKARWACDFCEKTQDEVDKLFIGPRELAICNECVSLCVGIIASDAKPLPEADRTAAQDAGDQKGGAA